MQRRHAGLTQKRVFGLSSVGDLDGKYVRDTANTMEGSARRVGAAEGMFGGERRRKALVSMRARAQEREGEGKVVDRVPHRGAKLRGCSVCEERRRGGCSAAARAPAELQWWRAKLGFCARVEAAA
jgi:hypothetical protein